MLHQRVREVARDAAALEGAEDFSYFAERVPGLYFWLGIRDPALDPADAIPNHSPRFTVDESALGLGVRALASLVLDYQAGAGPGSGGS